MRETHLSIDSADGLISFLKTVNSQIKINREEAEIIMNTLCEHQVTIHTDKEGNLYMTLVDREPEITTLDDVVDLACEYNYEAVYEAGENVRNETEFVKRCKAEKVLDKLKKEADILDKVFYQTKYGRKVSVVADRICSELCDKLCLIPIYNLPMYEDKVVSEETVYDEQVNDKDLDEKVSVEEEMPDIDDEEIIAEEISEDQIVESEVVISEDRDAPEDREETKGAR